MHIDRKFASGYDIQILRELSNTSLQRYFYPPLGAGGRDGVLVEITPSQGVPWIGQFAFGSLRGGVSAVFSLPFADHIAVVASGTGYVVRVNHPSDWKHIECEPVRQVRVLRHLRLALFVDWTRIIAYGEGGLVWASERLCWDDLKIVGIENEVVLGCGFDPTDAAKPEKRFALDVRTGIVLRTEFRNLWPTFKRRWKWFGKLVSDEGFSLAYGNRSITYTDQRGSFQFGFEDGFLFSNPLQVAGKPVSLQPTEVEEILKRTARGIRSEGRSVEIVRR